MRIPQLLLVACQIDMESSCKDRLICWNLWGFNFFCLRVCLFEKCLQGQIIWRWERIVLFSSYCNWILSPFFPFYSLTLLSLFSMFDCILLRRLPRWHAGLFCWGSVMGTVGTPPKWAWDKPTFMPLSPASLFVFKRTLSLNSAHK